MNPYSVIAEPSRRQLLDALLDGPQPVNQLVERVGMSQPVVSKHLKILRDGGFVEVFPEGQKRLYSLRPEPLEELDGWLQQYRVLWSNRLDALERHLGSIGTRENNHDDNSSDGNSER